VQPIFEDQGSASYTLAGAPPPDPLELDPRHSELSPPHDFDQSDVIDIGAEQVRRNRGTRDDLESALEALDVDLDDLSIPHASTELVREGRSSERSPRPSIRPPSTSQQARSTGRIPVSRRANRQSDASRPQRPVSDDGILIDFDDDDGNTK
jgi:hypothetical protein